MPISPDLLEILVCPETRQPVALASEAVLTQLNSKIAEERLRNRGGERVTSPIAEGLVREDGRILYPIDDGIPRSSAGRTPARLRGLARISFLAGEPFGFACGVAEPYSGVWLLGAAHEWGRATTQREANGFPR